MNRSLSAIAIVLLGGVVITDATIQHPIASAMVIFSEQPVNQSQLIILAQPRGATAHSLLILQQLNNQRLCWQVNPDAAQTVQPLLLNFNFTGICNRYTDSNGFSIRVAGQDLALQYSLRMVTRNNRVVLLGTSLRRDFPELEIGRSRGLAPGFLKIDLDPGWQLSQRSFNGKRVEHLYFSTTDSLATLAKRSPTRSTVPIAATPFPSPSRTPQPSPTFRPTTLTFTPLDVPPSPTPQPSVLPSPVAPTITPISTPVATPVTPVTQPAPLAPAPIPSPTLAALPYAPRAIPPNRVQEFTPAPGVNPLPTGNGSSPGGVFYSREANQIRQIYLDILKREPEPAGLAYHLQRLEAGRSIRQVREDIANSKEAQNRRAIDEIYQKVTGRRAMDTEIAYYLVRLEQGWTEAQVTQALANTPEGRTYRLSTSRTTTGSVDIPVVSGPPLATPTTRVSQGYFAIVPAGRRDIRSLMERIRLLGAPDDFVVSRTSPVEAHVAVGPFPERSTAEQWSNYLKGSGFDARVYFGR